MLSQLLDDYCRLDKQRQSIQDEINHLHLNYPLKEFVQRFVKDTIIEITGFSISSTGSYVTYSYTDCYGPCDYGVEIPLFLYQNPEKVDDYLKEQEVLEEEEDYKTYLALKERFEGKNDN